MSPDCYTCRWSLGCDQQARDRFRTQGYTLGKGDFRHGIGLVCEKRKIVAPQPCQQYEREAGAEG